ncbi:MAG: hypothetical protein G8237_14965 [Magnetococcales bacterium]|nr:hypothetical protein [Magnetococcales bacterium]
MKQPLILLLMANLLLDGCGHYSESTTQLDDRGHLLLTGRWEGTELAIDGQAPVPLLPMDPATTKRTFEIPTGKHRVVITQQGRVLVDRSLFFTSQTTTEVHVP